MTQSEANTKRKFYESKIRQLKNHLSERGTRHLQNLLNDYQQKLEDLLTEYPEYFI